MELDQPQDRCGAILALGQGRIPRAAALFLANCRSVELELQLVHRILLGLVDFVLCQLVVGDRIEPFHTGGDISVGDALYFQLVHLGEIRDLLEAERGVIHQPDRCGLGHQGFCHVTSP